MTEGIRAGVASLRGDSLHDGRYAHRIRWQVSSSYRRAVTITARGFAFTRGRSIRLEPRAEPGLRRVTTRALLPGPGCYTASVRGRGLRRQVVFIAR